MIGSYPLVAYRGWVGGIVSAGAGHQSRLADLRQALYYFVTLILQLVPYSIAGGVGIRLGLGAWRDREVLAGPRYRSSARCGRLMDALLFDSKGRIRESQRESVSLRVIGQKAEAG